MKKIIHLRKKFILCKNVYIIYIESKSVFIFHVVQLMNCPELRDNPIILVELRGSLLIVVRFGRILGL